MSIEFFAYVGLLNAVSTLALGSFVLIRNFRSATSRAFFFFMFSISYWCTNYFIWLSSSNAPSALFFIRNAMAGVAFIPTSFTYFVFLLAERKARVLHKVNLLCSIFFCIASFNNVYISGVERRLFFPFWPIPEFLFHLSVIHFFANIIGSHFVLWQIRGRFGGTKKIQVNYFLAGSLIGFSGGCTNYLLWYHIPFPPVLSFFVSIYAVMLAYAVFRHRMLDPDEILAIYREKLALAGLVTSSMNHEIKNALFILQETAKKVQTRLAQVSGDQLVIENIGKMTTQISRMEQVFMRFQEFGRPNPNPNSTEPVNLHQVIENALFFASQELKYRDIEVTLNLLPNLSLLKGDKSQFEEIFLNLIVNAYHAMPKGGMLTIEAKPEQLHRKPFDLAQGDHAAKEELIKIGVIDTGVGIPKEDLKSIFKPFYTTKAKEGTGLGLYIVKTLVEQNHGHISVTSEVGKGTKFVLNFSRMNF